MPAGHELEASLRSLRSKRYLRPVLLSVSAAAMSFTAVSAYNKNFGPWHTHDGHALIVAMEPNPIGGIANIFQNDPYHPIIPFSPQIEKAWEATTINTSTSSIQSLNALNFVLGTNDPGDTKFSRSPRPSTLAWIIDRGLRNEDAASSIITGIYHSAGEEPPQVHILPAQKFVTAVGKESWDINGAFHIPVLNQVDHLSQDLTDKSTPPHEITVITIPVGLRTIIYSTATVGYKDGFQNNHIIKRVSDNGTDYYALVMGNFINFDHPKGFYLHQKPDGALEMIAPGSLRIDHQLITFEQSFPVTTDVTGLITKQTDYYLENTYLTPIDAASDDELMTIQSAYTTDNPNAPQNWKQLNDLAQEVGGVFIAAADGGGTLIDHDKNSLVIPVGAAATDKGGNTVYSIDNADFYVNLDMTNKENRTAVTAARVLGALASDMINHGIKPNQIRQALASVALKDGDRLVITRDVIIQTIQALNNK